MKTNIDKWIHMKTNEDNACQTGYQTRFCVLELKSVEVEKFGGLWFESAAKPREHIPCTERSSTAPLVRPIVPKGSTAQDPKP